MIPHNGPVAQLGERLYGIQEVRGPNPLWSTIAMSEKLTMITAKFGNVPCPHGSTFCRRCYGEQVGYFEGKDTNKPAAAPKKKK